MTTEPRTTNYKPPLVLPSVRIVFTCCGASLLRNTVCSSFRPPAALRLEYPPHQLKPAAPGIHRPPLGLSAFLPPSSLTLHPWPITHPSSPPTFYPLPLIIKLAAAVAFWIYYSQHIAYPACPSQARSLSAQKESIMQNKPNLPRFCAKNSPLQEKQTQFKPNFEVSPLAESNVVCCYLLSFAGGFIILSSFQPVGRITAANTILKKSPAIKGYNPTAKAFLVPISTESQNSPKAYMMTFPKTIAKTVVWYRRSHPFSESKPTMYAANTKPMIYPPVGPASAAKELLPCANTGRPAAPAAIYVRIHKPPRRAPNNAPIINTAKVWPVKGTGQPIAICANRAINKEPPIIRAIS